MATTRKPLPTGQLCRLHYDLGCHTYMILYREGQEPLAREAASKWARDRDLAFTWTDAAAICEALPDPPLSCDPGCECDACIADRHREIVAELRDENERLRIDFEGAKYVVGMLAACVALLIWRPWA